MKALKSAIIAFFILASLPSFAQFTSASKSTYFGTDSDKTSEMTPNKGYKGFADLGYGIGVGNYATGRLEISTTHGYQFSPYFFAGVGAGINIFHDESSVNIPLFADFRGNIPIEGTKIAPFIDMKIGYSVADINGFYFTPSIGVRVSTSKRCGINIGLGYEVQKASYEYFAWGNSWAYYETGNVNAGAVTIKLGIDF